MEDLDLKFDTRLHLYLMRVFKWNVEYSYLNEMWMSWQVISAVALDLGRSVRIAQVRSWMLNLFFVY